MCVNNEGKCSHSLSCHICLLHNTQSYTIGKAKKEKKKKCFTSVSIFTFDVYM